MPTRIGAGAAFPFVRVGFFLSLFLLLFLRWSRPDASFPGEESDYGVHIGIVNQLLAHPFPLPYFGIIGAHSLAAGLHLLGIPIPKALLVLSDLSFLGLTASIAAVLRKASGAGRVLGGAALLVFSAPLFSSMTRDGFVGQVVSLGLYSLSLAVVLSGHEALSKTRITLSLALILLGTLCYPDGFLWCVPWLLLLSVRRVHRALWWGSLACYLAIASVLLLTQLGRLHLDGGGDLDWAAVLLVTAVWVGAGFAARLWTGSFPQSAIPHLFPLAGCWAFVAGLVCLVSFVKYGHLLYYARKNLYFLVVLAPILAASLASRLITTILVSAGLIAFVFSVPVTARERFSRSYARLAVPTSAFDGLDERCVEQIRAVAARTDCKEPVFLPGRQRRNASERWGQRILRLLSANSYVGRVDTMTGGIRGLSGALSQSFPLAWSLQRHPYSTLRDVRAAATPDVRCYAVNENLAPEDAPASCDCAPGAKGRSCLVLLRAPSIGDLRDDSPFAAAASGFQDETTCSELSGWVWSAERPQHRFSVEIVADGNVIATVLADEAREDLFAAGLGDGDYSFRITTPSIVLDGLPHSIGMRISGTQRLLGSGPRGLVCERQQSPR